MDTLDLLLRLLQFLIATFYVGLVSIFVLGAITLLYALWDPDWHEPDVEVLGRLDAEDAEEMVRTPVPTREDVGREDIDIHLVRERRN